MAPYPIIADIASESTTIAGDNLAWRILLGLGAVPAAAVIYLRSRMPESPRYQVQVQGKAEQAASQISDFTDGKVNGNGAGSSRHHQMGLRASAISTTSGYGRV